MVTRALLVAKPVMSLLLLILQVKSESPCYGRGFVTTNLLHLEQKKTRMIIRDALTKPTFK